MTHPPSPADREAPPELANFLAAYDPSIGRLMAAGRHFVLSLTPEASELIYDSYNAVAIAFSFSDKMREGFCHLAAYPGHVNLGFHRGAELADPEGRLQGKGRSIRHLHIEREPDLERPYFRDFVLQAIALDAVKGTPRAISPPVSLVMPTSSAKRRPTRR